MSAVGFTINGWNQSTRDFFPFEWVDVDPSDYIYRPLSLSFSQAFEYINRIRGFRLSMELSCLDDTVGGDPVEAPLGFAQTADRTFSYGGGERGIAASFNQTNNWPDWEYSQPPDLFPDDCSAFIELSNGVTTVPLKYASEDSFSPYLRAAGVIEGGDPGDRHNLAFVSTVQEPGFRLSAVEGIFMGEPFLVYESADDPYNHPVSGQIRIDANKYWGYSGRWDTTNGSQLVTPMSGGWT